jgi:hypothetical protein
MAWQMPPLLDAARRLRLFTDSKTLVDMPIRPTSSRAAVAAALAAWRGGPPPGEAAVRALLEEHFGPPGRRALARCALRLPCLRS